MMKSLPITLLALAMACKGSDGPAPNKAAPKPTASEPDKAKGLSWIHDDYPGALAAAKRENKPLLIDMWAEWCHTCLSMKHTVLADPSMQPFADRFVWLAVDTDQAVNAPVLEKFPVTAWPTFFVVSPQDESVQARYLGSSSVTQFRELLSEGERGHLNAMAEGGGLAEDDPLRLVRDGDRAAIAGELDKAAQAYAAALTHAAKDWPRRPDVFVSQIGALYSAGKWDACVDLGLSVWLETGNAASAADFLYYAGACAGKLPEGDERKKAMTTKAIKRLDRLVHDPAAPLSVDDRSDAMRIEREFLEDGGDKDSARRMAEMQRALLDDAAAAAETAYEASTYNWPRAEVYVYLDLGEQLVPVLEVSEKALPKRYDPPYRLAWVQLRLGKHDEALAAAERALALVYGPRKALVQSLIARIHAARGDTAAELDARKAVVAIYEALPAGQKKPSAEQRALEAVDKLAAAGK